MQSKEEKAHIKQVIDAVNCLQIHSYARLNDAGNLREFCSEILNIKNSLYKISKLFGQSENFLNSVDPALKIKFTPATLGTLG